MLGTNIEVRNKDLLSNCSSKNENFAAHLYEPFPKENDELFKTPNRFTSNKLKKIFMLRHKVKSDMEAPLRLTTYSNASVQGSKIHSALQRFSN